MCGICGIRRFGSEPISTEQIRILLIGNERRGNQATGVALQQTDGSIQVFKDDEPANRFVLDNDFAGFLEENLRRDTMTFIGHTRAATKGSPAVPKNNHPMWDGKVALVHNGVISNDDFLFRDLKLERSADTDSDIFRAILSANGFTSRATNVLNRVVGSAAIAAISTDYPGKLFLARSGNPIVMATNDADHFMWSSERQPIYDAMRPWVRKGGIFFRKARADYYFANFPNDTSWLIGDSPITAEGESQWLEWHNQFQTASYYRSVSYNVHENYASRRGVKKIKLIQCPNQECKTGTRGGRTMLQVTEAQAANLENIICPDCKTPLKRK
jgi:predicted glutamine amidotransferase